MGAPMGDFGPMLASIYLYVKDCDALYRRALQAGGTSVMEPEDQSHAGGPIRRGERPERKHLVDLNAHRRRPT